MKVFFVNTTKMWGGGEKWHLETACAMKDKGFDVAILALHGKDLYNRSVTSGIRTIPVQVSNLSFLNPFRIFALVRLLKKELPDVLILNFSADIKTVGIAAKITGIRNIIYRRGSAIPIRDTIINRFLYQKVITRIIANSIETRRTILQLNKNLVPAEKISVIYNGINLKQFDNKQGTVFYQRQENEVIIGNVGRLVLQKGQKYLIEIAVLLQKKNLSFKILIAGEGPLESSLKQMASEAGVGDKIVFLGFINNIKAFMDNIDIFVLPSLWEGFGYVLVEAMACRKPVVAFNISSNPEIITRDETGFLIENLDIEAMAKKVGTLIVDPGLRESIGAAGRRRVEETFDIAGTESNVEQLLKSLPGMNIEASVIISFYNKIDELKLVLSGFERQTMKNFELIIADDGSAESVVVELKQIMAGSPMKIKHVWHVDKGWQKNIILNKAIVAAGADYIIFTDGDCIPHRHFVKEHVQAKSKNLVLTGRRVMLGKKVSELLTTKMTGRGYLENMLIPWMLIDHFFGQGQYIENAVYVRSKWIRKLINKKNKRLLGSNFSLHKEDLIAINGFDERYLLPYVGEDTDLEYRLRLNGCKFKHLKHLAIQYHLYHKRQTYDEANFEIFNDNKKRATGFTPFGIIKS